MLFAGKLPLIELEVEGAEAVKLSKGIDSLTIFLAPPSLEVFEQRLVGWATESDEEVADRQAAAATQLAAAQANNVYDQVVVAAGIVLQIGRPKAVAPALCRPTTCLSTCQGTGEVAD